MVITFTLQPIYSGATYVAGPFNISGTTNTGVTTELASNVSKSTLLTGLEITGIDDATTGGTITSIGTCTNSLNWTVLGGTSGSTTYSFDIWCTENNISNPTSGATYQTVTFTGTELGQVPTYDTFLKITGSGNINYVYRFNGVINEPETVGVTLSTLLTVNDFICDDGTQFTYFCKETELSPCIEQASPCTGGQIQCGEFLAPA